MVKFMVAYCDGIKRHSIHNIDNSLTFGQAADIWPGKIVARIKKPCRFIFCFFLLNQRSDICPAANIPFTVSDPRHFIRFYMRMEVVGINDSDILAQAQNGSVNAIPAASILIFINNPFQ